MLPLGLLFRRAMPRAAAPLTLLASTILALAAVARRCWDGAAGSRKPCQTASVLRRRSVRQRSPDTDTNQIASSVTVVTAEQMEREQRRTLPDALSTVPGLNVVQAGGPGGLTSVFMRGTKSNHVKVLIDGIDVSDPSNPEPGVRLWPDAHGRHRAHRGLRGPQSGLYGADAIGGVISIITKKGEGPAKVTGTGGGGLVRDVQSDAPASAGRRRASIMLSMSRISGGRARPSRRWICCRPGRRRINDFYDNKTYSTQTWRRCDRKHFRQLGGAVTRTRRCISPAMIFPSFQAFPMRRKAPGS